MKAQEEIAIDPICGMQVAREKAAAVVERDGERFFFCSTHCRDEFVREHEHEEETREQHACCHGGHHSADETAAAAAARKPVSKYFCPMCEGIESDEPGSCPKCGMALEGNPAFREKTKTIYTCPMHPQIEQDHPGNCPICGMTLEPKNAVAGGEEDNTELRDMTRRFWIGAALSLPVFVLAMSHLFPSTPEWVQGDISRWVQFLLATPVVLWAGWPFFKRGWQSIVNRSLNMFTLIAIGVGAAYFYSAIVMLFPQLFPPSFAAHGKIGVYFESAA
ncbi:MAG: YHS domain-containing protein, partial [Verrucomicrobiota bacterium]|nr:YHS domain-containing protein [Verrucomicrobiota bacterium]